jgi:hypothetical protein
MIDVMSLTEFEDELRRIARFEVGDPVADVLSDAVKKITLNPALSQSRLLARVLRALAHQRGEFRRAEMAGFDTPTLRMVIGLMNAARDRTHTPKEWMTAVEMTAAAGAT